MVPTEPVHGSGAGRVLLLGATGTIGRATARALRAAGHEVLVLVRRQAGRSPAEVAAALPGVTLVWGDVAEAGAVAEALAHAGPVRAIVSCLASRTGVAEEAWAIDHLAHRQALQAAQAAGVSQFVLLSAICLQRPRLAFQQAKLAFEAELQASPLAWVIVRPTAYFKSLSGQVDRVRRGGAFHVFGAGTGTACRPISDDDLAAYLVACLDDPARQRHILPIGGPGPALTPLDQARLLADLTGQPLRLRSVPLALLEHIAALLDGLARLTPRRWRAPIAQRAEYARIGRYYASESMLVWDAASSRYRDDLTPSTGRDTLADHYRRLLDAAPRSTQATPATQADPARPAAR
ncbi:NAD(P)H-binding protein [Sphaerotilus mobilis]|uniref:Divinyl chlorophyllide a 8-vinyl-reductase, chloroplastic n=1 Tax=Sphaerotilus mobilis TaxID=47994 RepID=A0A4Q7LVW0_9BURK|nr:NAD(P)H-binding protein [Sphaerotilus mobilis]RZS58537.1 divinylchlorophyllide 8-vinylreductase [Sphaerotilus mobilis]